MLRTSETGAQMWGRRRCEGLTCRSRHLERLRDRGIYDLFNTHMYTRTTDWMSGQLPHATFWLLWPSGSTARHGTLKYSLRKLKTHYNSEAGDTKGHTRRQEVEVWPLIYRKQRNRAFDHKLPKACRGCQGQTVGTAFIHSFQVNSACFPPQLSK